MVMISEAEDNLGRLYRFESAVEKCVHICLKSSLVIAETL